VLSSISIDSNQKVLRCSLNLDGEKEPVDAEVEYELEQPTRSEMILRIKNLKASKAWIETVLDKFVPKDKLAFPLPKHIALAMKIIGL